MGVGGVSRSGPDWSGKWQNGTLPHRTSTCLGSFWHNTWACLYPASDLTAQCYCSSLPVVPGSLQTVYDLLQSAYVTCENFKCYTSNSLLPPSIHTLHVATQGSDTTDSLHRSTAGPGSAVSLSICARRQLLYQQHERESRKAVRGVGALSLATRASETCAMTLFCVTIILLSESRLNVLAAF